MWYLLERAGQSHFSARLRLFEACPVSMLGTQPCLPCLEEYMTLAHEANLNSWFNCCEAKSSSQQETAILTCCLAENVQLVPVFFTNFRLRTRSCLVFKRMRTSKPGLCHRASRCPSVIGPYGSVRMTGKLDTNEGLLQPIDRRLRPPSLGVMRLNCRRWSHNAPTLSCPHFS